LGSIGIFVELSGGRNLNFSNSINGLGVNVKKEEKKIFLEVNNKE
jgi:hypothetical protein